MANNPVVPPTRRGPSHEDAHPDKQERQAIEESRHDTASQPGGFKNDPDDPTNPNEVIERERRQVRP